MGLKSNERISATGTNSVSAGLALLDELPQLHAAVHQLLGALSDDDIDRNRLADIIDQCPSLSAKLVGLANSAYFGRASPIKGLSDAIFIIGFRTVRSLATATALQAPFENKRCPAFQPGRFWLHAVLTAHVARELAKNAAADLTLNPEEAYLAGLLHGMGLLALAHLFPDELNQILDSEDQTPGSMSARMLEKFGATHRSVGAALLKRWHLPEAFTSATEHYADPEYKGQYWTLCRLLAVAREWADRVTHREESDAFDPDGLTLLGITPDDGKAVGNACLERLEAFTELTELICGEKPVFCDPVTIAQAAVELKDRLVDTLESLSSLSALTNITIQNRNDHELLNGALKILMQNQDMQHCSIFLESDGNLVNAAGLSWAELNAGVARQFDSPAPAHQFKTGEGLIGIAAETRTIQHCRDCSVDPRFKRVDSENGYQPGSLISVPILFQDQILGVLNISHRQGNVFNEWHERFLFVFCNMLGQLITSNRLLRDMECEIEKQTQELTLALERAESLSILDGLTGVHNRRYFISQFGTLIEHCARGGHEMALLMIDIDNFKTINDSYGHLEGDRILKRVAGVLTHCARGADIIARFGGEEFIIALQDTDCEGSTQVADRILKQIRALSCGQGEQRHSITASIGLTCYTKSADMPIKTPEQWIHEADSALYRAKRSGKNRISVHIADDPKNTL
jgi:diguanylate cyclase (GGDEF)-like protein